MRVFKKKVLLSNRPWIRKRRRRERSKDEPNYIPLDLTLEIFSRLPAKLLVRSLYVSKLWSSFITLPSFINSFASRSSSRPRLLLTFSTALKKQSYISFPQHQNPDGSYSSFNSYQITNTNDDFITVSESVQGLVLLRGFKIWNPTLRRFFALPHPNEHIPILNRSCKSYLGYDPLEGKHKILCVLHNEYSEELMVLTLGAQESWRIITKRSPMHRPGEQYGRCFNGVLYYAARVGDQNIIMSFDVKSEKFSPIKYPAGVSQLWYRYHKIPYEGRLALVTYTFGLKNVDLRILKDADGHEWTHQSFLHVPCKSEWRNQLDFKGITNAGELIFAPSRLSESYYILYFDPRRNTSREALFEGIYGEIRRCGLSSNYFYTSDVLPNHTESLFSL